MSATRGQGGRFGELALGACELAVNGKVATVTIRPPRSLMGGTADHHAELGEIFSRLRGDARVRVVVITGSGGEFYVPLRAAFYGSQEARGYLVDPAGSWRTALGILRFHQTVAEIEKPVVAKVNGDAIGFGSSIAFACDLIVAAEDAVFCDTHLAMDERERLKAPPLGVTGDVGASTPPPAGIVPGDGAVSVVQRFFSPALAKEYLMLARPFRASELAASGAINAAVPGERLDQAVEALVDRLLARSTFALAWTKRTANRRVAAELNRSLDASLAYELVSQLHRGALAEPTRLAAVQQGG